MPELRTLIPLEVGAGVVPLGAEVDVAVSGDEAKHAVRARRARGGDGVMLFDAAGVVARGVVVDARRGLVVRVTHAGVAPALVPAIDVYSATPKGPRLDKMIDQLSQCGARSWTPMATAYGVVDPRETRLDRMQRITLESAKQCGRAHALRIGEKVDFAGALERAIGGGAVLLCDGSGMRLDPGWVGPAPVLSVMIGPEGGFTAEEVEEARERGCRILGLGPMVLRIETAAVVAVGLLGWTGGLREPGDAGTG